MCKALSGTVKKKTHNMYNENADINQKYFFFVVHISDCNYFQGLESRNNREKYKIKID